MKEPKKTNHKNDLNDYITKQERLAVGQPFIDFTLQTIEGENVKETILSLLTFDELGDEADFDFNKVIKMPKTVCDRVEWAKKHWGCKDNPLYTSVDMEQGRIDFETPWCPCLPVVEKLAELHK